MTIFEAIQQATKEVNIRSFRYADVTEFNAFKDSFNFQDYPCHVVVPVETRGTWYGGRRRAVAPIQGWIIQRIPVDADVTRKQELEAAYLEPMKQLCRQYFAALIETDIVDAETEQIQDTIKPEYMWLSSKLFGAAYTINLPVIEGTC